MVKVKVLFFATLRDQYGVREIEINFDGTLRGFFSELARRISPKIKEELFDENKGNVRENVIFLVNGINLKFVGGNQVRFKDGDTVAIFPPIGGG